MTGFSGINVALQTLLAQQAALEITQNNVANANTDGYHRQQAVLKAGYPTRSMAFTNTSGVQNIGTGVYVSSIKRFESSLIDTQYRRQVAENSKFSTLSEILSEVETNLSDTSTNSIGQQIDNFFTGWQKVATDPDLAANRADLLETAKSMVETFHNRMVSLIKIQTDQNTALTQRVDDINAIGKQLGELNAEIGRSQTETTQPNALLDERDRLIDQLANYIGVTVHVQDNNEVLVSIGGHALVSGAKAFTLEATPVASNKNLVKINWADDAQKSALTNLTGEVGGILYARDTVIEDQLSKLNDAATSIMNRVNALHRSGFDLDGNAGMDFFTSNSSLVNFNGNLDIYARIGSTYDMTLDVQDADGVSHQVALTLTKTATSQWAFSTTTAGASIVGNSDLTVTPNGTISFDASGNVTSTSGRILFGGNATSIDTTNLRQSAASTNSIGVSYQSQAMTIQVNPFLTGARSLSTAVNFSGNLDSNALVGDTYNITMDVHDSSGVSHPINLTLTKTALQQWTYSTTTAGATIVGNNDLTAIPNGTINFDASGNVTSNIGRILFGGNATSLDTSSLHQTALSGNNINVSFQSRAPYRMVAAATVTNAPGDGNNALAIANSIDTLTSASVAALTGYQDPVAAAGERSLRSWNTLRTTDLALEQRHAETGLSDTKSIMTAMSDQREAVIGVNLDEEAINMVKYQRAFQAATRLMNAFDEILESIVTNLGMVGR
jgi:flagellar hook-associated protein 1 FlgK